MKGLVLPVSTAAFATLLVGPMLSGAQPPFTLAPAMQVTFPLGNLPGLDPLVDPNTFFLIGPNQTKDLPLQLRGINFSGPAFVTTQCCLTGGVGASSSNMTFRIIPVVPAGLVFKKPPPAPAANEVRFSGQLGNATLRVSTPSNVAQCSSGTPCDEGTFLVEIDAFDSRNGYLSSAVKTKSVAAMTVMATPREGGGGCRGSIYQSTPERLPTSEGVTSVFTTKAATPSKTVFTIGVNAVGTARGNGWTLTIAKAPGATPPLTRNESIVDLTNTSGNTKSMYAINTANCGAGAAANAIVTNGGLGTMRINRTNTSTIVLSSLNNDAIAIFSEPAFWMLFGGRRVTINWFRG